MAVGTGNSVKGNWFNADGLPVQFPQHYTDAAQRINKPTLVATYGAIKQIVIPYDLSKLANNTTAYTTDRTNGGVTTGFSEHDAHIPANAAVSSCKVYPTSDAATGTSIAVGTYQIDGTIVDIDAFVTTSEGAAANLTKGKTVVGAGVALTPSSGVVPAVSTFNVWPTLVVSGAFTAGTGFIVIEYVDIAANPELFSAN